MPDAIAIEEGFEAGLKSHEIRFPQCRTCHRFHWYPMPRCPHCHSRELEWKAVGGDARVFTASTVMHAFALAWAARIPYTIALVEFTDAPGIRLVSRLTGVEDIDACIGADVEPVFDLSGPHPSVSFRPKQT